MSNYSSIYNLLKTIDNSDTYYTTAGNVGINSQNPTAKLEIVGTGNENLLKISDSINTQKLLIDYLGNIDLTNNLKIKKDGSLYLNSDMTDTELANSNEITSCIRINRGTANPSILRWNELYYRFEIVGVDALPKSLAIIKNYNNYANSIPYFSNPNEIDSTINFSYNPTTSTLTTADIKINNLTTNIVPFINSSKQLTNSDIYNVSNNVGIGTSTPSAKLHVNGQTISTSLSINTNLQIGKLTVFSDSVSSTVANGVFNSNDQATIYLRRITTEQQTVAGTYYGASIMFGDNVGTPFLASGISGVQTGSVVGTGGIIDDDQYGLAFFCHSGTGSGSVIQETMRITHDGKVAIGTTAPSAESILDINSTTLCMKLPMLLSSTRSPFTTEGLFCYDVTLKAPVYRNNLGWIEQRNILEELYYNISASTSQTTLSNTATDYRLSIEANMTSVPSTNNLFTNNGSAYINWKYTGTNVNTRYFKYMLKLSFYTDSAVSEKFSFSVYKNATFSTNTYSSGGTVMNSSYNQIHSSGIAGQCMAIGINFIDQTAINDVYTLVLRYSNTGKKITVNNFNVVCETYY